MLQKQKKRKKNGERKKKKKIGKINRKSNKEIEGREQSNRKKLKKGEGIIKRIENQNEK